MTSLKLAAIVHAATGTIEITKEKEMQSLLDAVVDRFTHWPKEVVYFNCDPDGEVRGRDPYVSGGGTTYYDFYPDVEIQQSDRRKRYGDEVGPVVVTKQDWYSAKFCNLVK